MSVHQETGPDPSSNSGGVLRTTTWGALIALSLVAMAGYNGLNHNTSPAKEGYHSAATAERTAGAPVQASAEQKATGTSPSTESKPVLSASTVWGTTYDNRRSLRKLNQPPAPAPKVGLSRQPVSSAAANSEPNVSAETASTVDEAAQKVIAAKLSPELHGIDSEKKLDVIVQFRQ